MSEELPVEPPASSFKFWKRVAGRGMSTLEGCYVDTKHGPCLRRIFKVGTHRYVIMGVYGNNERKTEGEVWSAVATTGEEESGKIPMTVDFTGKELKTDDKKKKQGVRLGEQDDSMGGQGRVGAS